MNYNNDDIKYRLPFVFNILFLLLMPAIYNIDNTFLSVVWTLLGGINAIYLLIKMRKDKQ
ncbi:hypothetical protein KZX25_12405 [Staphylococcus epidermidis]|uniref:hypothetical protein n=1 Tax=Staphylococcus epidermidis TaxID=1282 RepID=UPI00200679EF|nr:hypothetical protein [Staphylococcus epidermidis]MCK6119848.1 hypothetical protein [Staphylococcus epidermidis]MCK6157143.1 hypothetical protein [Staphylococcus epidermidis]